MILDSGVSSSSNPAKPPEKCLDEIYLMVLGRHLSTDYANDEREELCEMLRRVLGSIAILSLPLSAQSLSVLLHLTKEDVDQTLEDLESILEVPEDQSLPLRLHHSSFRDFLFSDRCGDPHFRVDEKHAHEALAIHCVNLMSATLKRDICGLRDPGILSDDIESDRVEKCFLPEVRYACLYWVHHLENGGARLCDDGQVHQFLREHLLHWLEALSLMKETSKAAVLMAALESAITVCAVEAY
jgi:hypothetical protein